MELAALDRHERAGPAVEQMDDRRIAEIARVLGIEGNRRRTAQLVADGLVDDRHLDAALLQADLHLVLDLAAEVDLGDADVALRVAVHVLQLGHLARAESLDERLGQQHHAMRLPHRAALDDAALDDVAQCRRARSVSAVKLFRDDGAGRAHRLADAEREVSGRPSHGHAEIPAPGRPRVLHQALDDADADVTGRLVAQRGERQGHPQVVVDALRHLHDLDRARGPLERDRASHEVVAADADQRLDAQLAERSDRVLQALPDRA